MASLLTMPKQIIYRDRKTGRFVSGKTWNRSKSRGGKRYVRQTVKRKVPRKKAPPKRKPPSKVFDWLIIWHYKGQPARDIGFIASAKTEDDALNAVSEFMASDKFAKRIPASGFHNWTVARVERRKTSANRAGHVEYREQE